MAYAVLFDEAVFKKDFRTIDRQNQKIIIKTIRKKLAAGPTQYGKPLTKELRGYWKLKIGPFRVVYQIIQHKLIVYVITVGFRRDEKVYSMAIKRLGLF